MKKLVLWAALISLWPAAGEAASCRFLSTHVCRGCSENATAKMKRFDAGETRRWCRLAYGTGRDAFRGIKVIKGFDLGELRTGRYSLRFSPLRTGTSTVVYELHGRAGDTGQPFVSRVAMRVEVVDGEF